MLPYIKREKKVAFTYVKALILLLIFILVAIFHLPKWLPLWFPYTVMFLLTFLLNYKELISDFKIFRDNFKIYFKFIIKRYLFMLLFMFLSGIIIVITKGSVSNNQKEINEMLYKAPILTFLLTTLYAPIVEETVFRLSLSKLIKNETLFVIISGLLFGFMHVISSSNKLIDYIYIIQYATLGFCLAKAYSDSKNIYVSVSMHFIQNFLSCILVFILKM